MRGSYLHLKISFVYNCMHTRLRGQYNGKWPISLVYVSRSLVTVITAIVPIRWQTWLIEKNYHTGSTYRWIITEIIKMQSTAQLTIQHISASIVGIDWCDLDLDEKWFLKPELGSFYDVFKFCKRQLKNVSKCLSHVNHGFSLPTAPRSQWLAWVSFGA